MRSSVYFTDISHIVPISSPHTKVPANIAIASGADRCEKRADGIRILANNPHINVVVLLERQRSAIDLAISSLRRASTILGARRLKTAFTKHAGDSDVFKNLVTYFDSRASQGAPSVWKRSMPALDLATQNLAGFLDSAVKEVRAAPGVSLQESQLTFVNGYWHERNSGAFINCHVDQTDGFDLREVECCNGSGTILFSSKDFSVESYEKDGRIASKIDRARGNITCWELVSGSSAILRVPTLKDRENGTMPAAHAHGIGNGITPELRLTLRHDLNFS